MNEQHLPLERLIDYLHGELAPDEDARVLAHVETCQACHAAYETEAQLNDALREYKADEFELPPGVVATIWDRVDRERLPSWRTRLVWLTRPALTFPSAAVLLIAACFGVANFHGAGSQTTIDAAYYLDDHAALTTVVPFDEASASVVPASLESDDPEADQQWVVATDTHTTNVSP